MSPASHCPLPTFLYYHGTGGRRTAGGGKTRATSVEHVWNARYARRYTRGERAENVLFVLPLLFPCSTGKSISIDSQTRVSENLLNRAELRRQVGKSIPCINPFTDRKRVTNQRNLHFPFRPRGISRGFPPLLSLSCHLLNSSVAILVFTIQATLRIITEVKKQFLDRRAYWI